MLYKLNNRKSKPLSSLYRLLLPSSSSTHLHRKKSCQTSNLSNGLLLLDLQTSEAKPKQTLSPAFSTAICRILPVGKLKVRLSYSCLVILLLPYVLICFCKIVWNSMWVDVETWSIKIIWFIFWKNWWHSDVLLILDGVRHG